MRRGELTMDSVVTVSKFAASEPPSELGLRAGQKIAEKGSSGTDSVRLHFEIRKAGKPIDPLKVLPRR